MTIAYLLSGMEILIFSGKGMRTFFLNLELYRLISFYLILETILAVFFMMTNKEPADPAQAFVWQFAALGAFLAFTVLAIIRKNAAEEAADKIKMKKLFLREISGKLQMIASNCTDFDLRKKIHLLGEDLHYSSPSIDPKVITIEEEIEEQVNVLEQLIYQQEMKSAKEELVQIQRLIKKRNQICRSQKIKDGN